MQRWSECSRSAFEFDGPKMISAKFEAGVHLGTGVHRPN